MIIRPIVPFLLVAVFALGLAACGSDDEDEEVVDSTYVEGSVESLYNEGMDLLLQERQKEAADMFAEVERQHPYSVWATKSQIMAGYAYYQAGEYDDAINSLDRFISLHPGNRDTAYAYYLRALSYYEQISDVKRDQRITELALNAFEEVVRRFPHTKYASDAAEKIDLTQDHLAGKEMDIGRYYLRQQQYLAAINRFRTVVVQFQTSTHTPEALHRLVESYTALGLTDEAQRTAAVLGYNFPENPWYADSYQLVEGVEIARAPNEDEGSFWAWLF
ncbi:MAG: outer membrane protein assembly factor BamD [Rhodospirillaceae bacterium]|jgi:outer membrane protein assembly factor BamD|nr:outer membrane protein assembly factor BamD [Rhodospirillaceae bacterium]MBT6116473.1 outer membrane protein assembly factor BamD [Rhodospirillaceae bacterium]